MKKYLKSKVDLEVILQDNKWFFEKGTIFIFESVGWSVELHTSYSYDTSSAYIKTECIRLNKVIYNKMVSFYPEIKYEITELEENVINTIFKYTYKLNKYIKDNCVNGYINTINSKNSNFEFIFNLIETELKKEAEILNSNQKLLQVLNNKKLL